MLHAGWPRITATLPDWRNRRLAGRLQVTPLRRRRAPSTGESWWRRGVLDEPDRRTP